MEIFGETETERREDMMAPSIGPIRPPSEAYSLLVRVTKNCPWNRCEFCSVFKGQRFEVRPIEEVKHDIRYYRRMTDEVYEHAERRGNRAGEIARYSGMPWILDDGVNSAFIQDSDSLVMKTEQLVEILSFLRETFPTLERICTYARGKTVFRKDLGELEQIRNAGLSRIHIGLESGDDELLAYIKKGATADEMIAAGKKAREAGFEVSEYFMPGLGGVEKWEPHAIQSARVLNSIDPHFIRLRSFHRPTGTPIFEKAREEQFHMQTIEGLIREVRLFISELDVTSRLVTSDYAHNYYLGEIDGQLPREKDRILASVDTALEEWRERGEPKRNPFLGALNREN